MKHQLRDCLEARLALPKTVDEAQLARDLNKELRDAGPFCNDSVPDKSTCPEWTLSGYLNPLKLSRWNGFLILQTGVGIECGFDESAHLFASSDEGWRRVWQTEQNTYLEGRYKPQTIQAVLLSPYNQANDYLALDKNLTSRWIDGTVWIRHFRLHCRIERQRLDENPGMARLSGIPA